MTTEEKVDEIQQDTPQLPIFSLEEQAADIAIDEKVHKGRRTADLFAILAAGSALISDGLQNNIQNLTNVVFTRLYPTEYTSEFATQASNALTVGCILGQISVGVVCDRVGRKAAILTATIMITLGIILATAAHGANGSFTGFIWFFTIARGITGFGVGGEYPASSTSAAEAANEISGRWRGPVFILATNFVLSFGGPLASIIYIIVSSAAGEDELSTIWRTVYGISAIFPVVVLGFRLKMLNSKLYKRGAMRKRVPYLLVIRKYWKRLIGTCGAWISRFSLINPNFTYDFVVFPNGSFSGLIISTVIGSKATIRKTAEWQLLLGAIALPGVFVGALLCNSLGRKNTMMLGFSGFIVLGLIIGCLYFHIIENTAAFVILYGLIASVGNLGPGDFLGLISAESYPTAVRGTCYGLSAAIGKTGAVIGTEVFLPVKNSIGLRYVYIISAAMGVLGVLVTYIFVPTLTAEDLAREDAEWNAYLVAHGWTGEIGEGDDARLISNQPATVEAIETDSDTKVAP